MKKYAVYGIGNALVDMEYEVSEEFLAINKIEKGRMTLVEEDRQNELLQALGGNPIKRQCGGSAANTIIAVTQLGGKCFYSCKVANDSTGDFYRQDLIAAGVDSNLRDLRPTGTTGKCLVLVGHDAERTMNTYLGITSTFSPQELDAVALADSRALYIEGYLVASPTGLEAALAAREIAAQHGVMTALTFSDPAMVKFFSDGMRSILGPTGVDLLFANEDEALAFASTGSLVEAVEALKKIAKTFVVTRGELGALAYDGKSLIEIAADPVKAVDSNGAGDMFAGAFLYALTIGRDYASAGRLAARAAAQVVSQYGPRLTTAQTQNILRQVF